MTTTTHNKSPKTFSTIFQWRSLKTRVTILTLAIFLIGIWSLEFYASRMEQTIEQVVEQGRRHCAIPGQTQWTEPGRDRGI